MPKLANDKDFLGVHAGDGVRPALLAPMEGSFVTRVATESASVDKPAGVFRMAGMRQRFATLVEIELAHGAAFLFAPVCLGLGAVLWFTAEHDPSPAFYRVLLFIGCVFSLLFRHRIPALGIPAAALALVAAGMWLAENETARKATVLLDSPVTVNLTGRVVSREAVAGGGFRYIVDVTETANPVLKRPPRRAALIARASHVTLADGQGIAGRARLSPPSGPAMPGLTDFAFSSYFQEIGAIGFFYGAPRPTALDPLRQDFQTGVRAWISHLRSVIGERIRSIIPGDAGAFATAMVTDERRAMTRETAEALRLSGLAHIIAISGLNMALSAGIFFVGLRMVLSLSQAIAQSIAVKKLAALGALAGVTAYYLLSGSAVSAERAWLMMSIMLIAVLIGRPSISMRNVALSALVILVLSPSDVMGASFQMSFAATAALVSGYALFKDTNREDEKTTVWPVAPFLLKGWQFVWGIAMTSIIGGVSTAIFSIAHFQQLAIWGLPANLAAMPIVSFVVMPAGLLAMLLMPFGLDTWPLQIMGLGLGLVIDIATEISSWGGEGGAGLLPPHAFPLIVTGFLVLTLLKTRLRLAGAFIIAATLVTATIMPSRQKPAILIAESGDLIGLIGARGIATNRERPPSFIFSQWQRALAIQAHLKPAMIRGTPTATSQGKNHPPVLDTAETQAVQTAMTLSYARSEQNRFTCQDKAWCVARYRRGPNDEVRLAYAGDAAYIGAACQIADIIVTPVRLRQSRCPIEMQEHTISGQQAKSKSEGVKSRTPSTPRLITAATMSRSGAIAIRLETEGQTQIETARNKVVRPWTRHRLYDWRRDRFVDDAADSAPSQINDTDE